MIKINIKTRGTFNCYLKILNHADIYFYYGYDVHSLKHSVLHFSLFVIFSHDYRACNQFWFQWNCCFKCVHMSSFSNKDLSSIISLLETDQTHSAFHIQAPHAWWKSCYRSTSNLAIFFTLDIELKVCYCCIVFYKLIFSFL